jgi:hypothetical protein
VAHQTVTSTETAQWLKEQGAVASESGKSPLEKIAIISAALLAKLRELELSDYLEEAKAATITAALLNIISQPDADDIYTDTKDKVVNFIHKVLNVLPEDNQAAVTEAQRDIERTLCYLRFGKVTVDLAMTHLISDITWLANSLGWRPKMLRDLLQEIDATLWQLLSPYHPAALNDTVRES